MNLNFKKIPSQNGKIPQNPAYATEGSACFDLTANIDSDLIILPNHIVKIPTGLAIEIPTNEFVALVFARSGLSSKFGISLANSVGVIDSDYRGEIIVALINNSNDEFILKPGDRIAQLGLFPVFMANLCEVDTLNDTKRGDGGFGSTGK